MIRVGIALESTWLGGVSYYRNLLHAIAALPDRRIEPVLLIGQLAPDAILAGFPPVEVIRTGLLDRRSPSWLVRRGLQQAFARDPLLESLLHHHGVDVLSHSGILGRSSTIPAICWIPDFQHREMPQFFTRPQRWYRDASLRLQCDHAARLILSSEDARRALTSFRPSAVARSRILRFVAQPDLSGHPTDRLTLERRYEFAGEYLHVPNQLWAHKNHGLILKALALLRGSGETPPLVLSTGPTEDYRQPGYFERLMGEARTLGVADSFRVLGVIPRDDLVGLMIHSVALLNPSRYEGWSTSVEEAKSLGKRIILSDLLVHREQAAPDAVYVDPDDSKGLATAMRVALTTSDQETERLRQERARRDFPGRVQAFARTFESIVIDVS